MVMVLFILLGFLSEVVEMGFR